MVRSAFYASRCASQAGQGMFLAVLVVLVGGASSNAFGLSAMLVAATAGSVLFGLPAGVLIDRIGAPRALLMGGTLRLLVIVATLASIGRAEYAPLFAFAYSSVSQVFSPAELALVRTLNPHAAGETHATLIALQYGAQGAGLLAIAPALHAWGGLFAMVAGAGATYVLVVAIAAFLASRVVTAPRMSRRRPVLAWTETVTYLRNEHRAVYAAGLLTFAEIASKALIVSVPTYFRDDLGLTPIEAGAVVALGGVGLAAGLGWGGRRTTATRAPLEMRSALVAGSASVLALAALAGAITTAVVPLGVGLVATAGVAVVLGFCTGLAPVSARTVFSVTAPAGLQGRIFATQAVVTDMLTVAPVLAVGAMTSTDGPRLAMTFVAALGLVLFAGLELSVRHRKPALDPVLVRAGD